MQAMMASAGIQHCPWLRAARAHQVALWPLVDKAQLYHEAQQAAVLHLLGEVRHLDM